MIWKKLLVFMNYIFIYKQEIFLEFEYSNELISFRKFMDSKIRNTASWAEHDLHNKP